MVKYIAFWKLYDRIEDPWTSGRTPVRPRSVVLIAVSLSIVTGVSISDAHSDHESRPHRKDALAQGLQSARLGHYDQAIAEFTTALKSDPNNADAHFYRGVLYEATGVPKQALADYTRAIEIDPAYATPYLNRGMLYKAHGQFDHALADLTKALEINPRWVAALTNRGNIYSAQGRYELALADFNAAIAHDPTSAVTYTNRGYLYIHGFDDWPSACTDFKRACELGLCENYQGAKTQEKCE